MVGQFGLLQLYPVRTSVVSHIAPLQRGQNAAAQIVLGLSPRDHVRSALKELHWLPITYSIKFKISLVMYLARMHCCLSYISLISYHLSTTIPVVSGTTHLMALRTNTKFGEQAISVSGPSHWNSLPETTMSMS